MRLKILERNFINWLYFKIKTGVYCPDSKLDNNGHLKFEIKKICNHLNIKILNLDPAKSVLWDGKYIRYKNLSIANIFHEIGHFQVALPSNRYQIDFGLGGGPESKICSDCTVKENFSYHELYDKDKELIFFQKKRLEFIKKNFLTYQEHLASILGILWCAKYNIKIMSLINTHCWVDYGVDWYSSLFHLEKELHHEALIAIKFLYVNNLIDSDFNPRLILRQ